MKHSSYRNLVRVKHLKTMIVFVSRSHPSIHIKWSEIKTCSIDDIRLHQNIHNDIKQKYLYRSIHNSFLIDQNFSKKKNIWFPNHTQMENDPHRFREIWTSSIFESQKQIHWQIISNHLFWMIRKILYFDIVLVDNCKIILNLRLIPSQITWFQ